MKIIHINNHDIIRDHARSIVSRHKAIKPNGKHPVMVDIECQECNQQLRVLFNQVHPTGYCICFIKCNPYAPPVVVEPIYKRPMIDKPVQIGLFGDL